MKLDRLEGGEEIGGIMGIGKNMINICKKERTTRKISFLSSSTISFWHLHALCDLSLHYPEPWQGRGLGSIYVPFRTEHTSPWPIVSLCVNHHLL